MSNELSKKGGAQASKPTRYGILWTGRWSTGVWTQRSPLRDAASTRLEEEYYGSRGDSWIDGLNSEISARLTPIRRPGSSVYNSQSFPAITRFYENRTSVYNATQTVATESIQVLADTADVVYDATGPSTKTVLFTKTAGAGSTYFQSVGNSLYFSDGPDQKKYLTSQYAWFPGETFTVGSYIVDSNGNIQSFQAQAQSYTVTNIEIRQKSLVNGVSANFVIFTFSTPAPVNIPSNYPVTIAGITAVGFTFLNGLSGSYSNIAPGWNLGLNLNQVAMFQSEGFSPIASAVSGGTVTFAIINDANDNSETGVTGITEPIWNTVPRETTQDGTVGTGVTWTCFGPQVEDWAIPAPTSQPFPITPGFNMNISYWSPSSTTPFVLIDSNGFYQVLFSVAGITGTVQPVWSTKVGGFTSDGGDGVTWQNVGQPSPWVPSFQYSTPVVCIIDPNGNLQVTRDYFQTQTIWTAGVANTTGATDITSPGPAQPAWGTTIGAYTTDGSYTWQNLGGGTILSSGTYQYAYSYHSVDGSVTTASPVSYVLNPILGLPNLFQIDITVPPSPNSQVDQIWIWRTVGGGSTLFYLDQIPSPVAGGNITYADTLPDVSVDGGPSLNIFITAPIADSNNPPPLGITALAYHLGRIWGVVGTSVYYSEGPDAVTGNGSTAWSPSSVFVFPSNVTRLFPSVNGLFIFTVSDVYLIGGLGTASSAFYSTTFYPYLGIVSYDAFSVNGSTVYMYTSDNQVVSMDLNSGLSEIGFPIGDQFGPENGTGTFTPASTQVAWHISGSPDKGLYVSDFQGTWWRLCPTPSPETGTTWSPKAKIVNGFSSVQSVETTPGTRNLLIGPLSSGPILKRDSSVFTDNGSVYNAFFTLGSVVLAQPGQLASVVFFTTDSTAIGAPPTLAVQLDEIGIGGMSSVQINSPGNGYSVGQILSVPVFGLGTSAQIQITSISGDGSTGPVTGLRIYSSGSLYPTSSSGLGITDGPGSGLTINLTGGFFESLESFVPDPTQLEPSTTMYSQRFYISQTQLPAVCRSLQIQVLWGEDVVQNEILSLTLFGGFESEL